ncbi:lysophospholipid acyltransferase family protein [Novosphingobium aquimarinum]|uniref:lysophospholipid acyltransferase family protein n=1 Tax=Novosphingobium aquimarinum TaxID=2682494 RepID=UPI0012ECA418|nr:lysophospholipid acyltransferase family protein [Novosphingobium aquimarinum]
MAGFLLVALVAFYLLRPFLRRNPVPARFLGGVARIAGVRVRRIGDLPQGRAFFLANHVSWLDICVLASTTGCAFIAHDGLAAFGPLRWLCRLNDTVFVARADRGSVAAQVEQVRQALCETGALTLFPEATTGPGAPLLPFKSALVSALVPLPQNTAVVPVAIDYGRDMQDIAWVGEEPGVDNFLRVLARRRPFDATVSILPELVGPALSDRKTITRAARAAIETALTDPPQRVAL